METSKKGKMTETETLRDLFNRCDVALAKYPIKPYSFATACLQLAELGDYETCEDVIGQCETSAKALDELAHLIECEQFMQVVILLLLSKRCRDRNGLVKRVLMVCEHFTHLVWQHGVFEPRCAEDFTNIRSVQKTVERMLPAEHISQEIAEWYALRKNQPKHGPFTLNALAEFLKLSDNKNAYKVKYGAKGQWVPYATAQLFYQELRPLNS